MTKLCRPRCTTSRSGRPRRRVASGRRLRMALLGIGAARSRRDRRLTGGLGGGVDQLLELLAGLEVRDPLGGDVDLVARLRISPLTRAALADAEAAETAELDLVV